MTAPIRFENVSKSFEGQVVVDHLDWQLPLTGTLCLFGPSGCGKTTLLHLIAGIHQPDGGRIHGLDLHTASMVFQEPRLLPWLSAMHNITAVLPASDRRDIVARDWLDLVGLENAIHKLPDELSGGMRQRVAIARALASGGDLLLLDEPTQGLDAEMRTRMIQLIRADEGKRLTVLVTHDPDEAEALESTIIRMSGPPVVFFV